MVSVVLASDLDFASKGALLSLHSSNGDISLELQGASLACCSSDFEEIDQGSIS